MCLGAAHATQEDAFQADARPHCKADASSRYVCLPELAIVRELDSKERSADRTKRFNQSVNQTEFGSRRANQIY